MCEIKEEDIKDTDIIRLEIDGIGVEMPYSAYKDLINNSDSGDKK